MIGSLKAFYAVYIISTELLSFLKSFPVYYHIYRIRVINHRGFYSKITILTLKLPEKKRIKTAF